jgi:hypothetical protein
VTGEVEDIIHALRPYMKDDVRSTLQTDNVDRILSTSESVMKDLKQLQQVVLDRYTSSAWNWRVLLNPELRATMGRLAAHRDALRTELKLLLLQVDKTAPLNRLPPTPDRKGLCILSLSMSYEVIKSQS